MNNDKTGKLIAKLRNQHELTQQELGDKVGVGFRAVSNWERGNSLPDIANLNELSKIFGITIDELMAGELNEKKDDKKKLSKKSKIIISIITAITLVITIISIIFTTNNNKKYIYELISANQDEYIVEGQASFNKGQISIIISKLRFKDNNLSSTSIKNYEYQIMSKDIMLYGFGLGPNYDFEKTNSIKETTENLRINYIGDSKLKRNEIVENNIIIQFTFWTENNQLIEKKIEIELLNPTIK